MNKQEEKIISDLKSTFGEENVAIQSNHVTVTDRLRIGFSIPCLKGKLSPIFGDYFFTSERVLAFTFIE